MREEIAKLQEMLDADGEKILVPAGAQGKNNKSQPGGGVSVSKGSVKGGKRTKGSQGSSSKKKKVSQKEGKGEMEKCGILRFLYQVEP